MNFLSQEERDKLKTVRDQVIDSHEELRAEGEKLKEEREAIRAKGRENITPQDWQGMMQKTIAYEQKVRAAAIQLDPSVEPVYKKIEEAFRNGAFGGPRPGGLGAPQTSPTTSEGANNVPPPAPPTQ